MPMPDYPVRCYAPGCGNLAVFKIAAAWSDGLTSELKTYSLCCAEHLETLFRDACARHALCRIGQGETLEAPGIYEWSPGHRDTTLRRRPDLESPSGST